jgi:hypothetical protein
MHRMKFRITLLVLLLMPFAGCLTMDKGEQIELELLVVLENPVVASPDEIRGELTLINRTGREMQLIFPGSCQLTFSIIRRQQSWQYVEPCTDSPTSMEIPASGILIEPFNLAANNWNPQTEHLPGLYTLLITLDTAGRPAASAVFEVAERP